MWDVIVLIPDHFPSIYFPLLYVEGVNLSIRGVGSILSLFL